MDQITASPADTAAVAEVLRTLGPIAVVRMVPVVVATAGVTRRRTDVQLWAGPGRSVPRELDAEGARIARDTIRAAFPGRTWTDAAYDYHADGGRLVEVLDVRVPPGTAVLSLADSLAADADDQTGGDL